MSPKPPRFLKATPGHGELSRYLVVDPNTQPPDVDPNTQPPDQVPVGFVVARRGRQQTGVYWQAYALYGQRLPTSQPGRPFLTRKEAGNAVLVHTRQQVPS